MVPPAGTQTTHHNGVLQIVPEANGTRVHWTTDLRPHEMAKAIQGLQEQALAVMKKTFEQP